MQQVHWENASIPLGESPGIYALIGAIYICTSNNVDKTPAYYLQGVRSGAIRALGPEYKARRLEEYQQAQPKLVNILAEAVHAQIRTSTNAAGICPPSSRGDARPYIEKMIDKGIITRDVSDFLCRADSDFRAGTANDNKDIASSLVLVRNDPNILIDELVIVDDIINTGRTAAAIVKAFYEANFLTNDARILVVAPLRILPSS